MAGRLRVALALAAMLAPQTVRAQDPTIRETVQEVVLDMVVRDHRGREVKNLRPSDVTIYEDGVKQDIRSFRWVDGKEIAAAAARDKEQTPESRISASPLPVVNLVCIVLHNLDPYNKKNALDAAREFIQSSLPSGAWAGVFSLDTRLNVLHPFTTNREELLRAAAKVFAGPPVDFASSSSAVLSSSPNIITIQQIVNGSHGSGGSEGPVMRGGELNSRAILGADVSNSPASNAVRGDLAGQRREFGGIAAMQAMDQLDDLIAKLGTLPGRKTVLFLSPGLVTNGDTDLFKAMLEKAVRAGISFYAVDINGLTQNSNTLASTNALSHSAALSAEQGSKSGSAADMMERMRQSDYVMDATRTSDTQASLRALSEGTGGFLTGSTNDFRKPFLHILQDMGTHYEAIYHASSSKYDGRLRAIEVKLDRPDLTVESRTGYFAMPYLGDSGKLEPYEVTGLAALSLQKPPHAFQFQSAALQFRSAAGKTERSLVFEFPASELGAALQPQVKMHRMHASVLALVRDARGDVVDKFSQDSPYEIPDANFAAAQNSTILFTHSLSLPAGRYTVDTAIVDRETDRVSTGSIEFDNPVSSGLGISSIVLVQRMEDRKDNALASNPFQFQTGPSQSRQVTPRLASTLPAGAHPYVYFVVYPDPGSSEKPAIHVEFIVDGKVIAQQEAALPPPNAAGEIPMVIGAPANPGNCELRIIARQGGQSAAQRLSYIAQ
ncbi:MAG TPA: VWA domain-containing protein [Bryobacteraceae bacterium]|jgi:VWFA-related protein|nr:VWA domain-containing protein [Bryobacteraceae bacterium]